ncbi:SDR family oxidoreductase [Streptomyces sp. NPDC020883]|uniref:SDR family oxidoreductase n=1 Tax=Streptomyces sp. NPDC020883 TaxID=3365099 RepID=UPI003789D91E
MRFADRVAVVTGASRGIGLAVAQRLVSEGCRVCITGRDAGQLAEAVGTFRSPERVITSRGHADDPDHQAATVDRTLDRFGRVDAVVNNAAVNPVYGPILQMDDAAMRKVIEVNVVAAVGWIRTAHAAWLNVHGGTVVNVAAVAGFRPVQGIGLYGASKAALMQATQQLAVELGPQVRVNAVAPAVVKTKFAAKLYEGREAEVAAAYPLRRLGSPADIAGAVAFLASDDSGWVTGQTLVVDGGLSLGAVL